MQIVYKAVLVEIFIYKFQLDTTLVLFIILKVSNFNRTQKQKIKQIALLFCCCRCTLKRNSKCEQLPTPENNLSKGESLLFLIAFQQMMKVQLILFLELFFMGCISRKNNNKKGNKNLLLKIKNKSLWQIMSNSLTCNFIIPPKNSSAVCLHVFL